MYCQPHRVWVPVLVSSVLVLLLFANEFWIVLVFLSSFRRKGFNTKWPLPELFISFVTVLVGCVRAFNARVLASLFFNLLL